MEHYRVELGMGSRRYVKATPKSTIHPWKEDPKFQKLYSLVRDYTLVDEYRLYELWCLVQQIADLDGDLLEVGVWRGGSAAVMLNAMGSGKTLYAADTFSGVVKAGEHDAVYTGGEHADCDIKTVQTLLSHENIQKNARWQLLRGIFPDDCAIFLENNLFCFCHIDVDVYASAKEITHWIWPRLVSHGMVVFDDYGFANCNGVRKWVDEFCASIQPNALLLYNLNGHAVVVKR